LSLNEIYLVALTYKNGSPEFIELFETAVSVFPDDKIANLNAASAALSRKDTLLAEKYLKRAETSTPEYENGRRIAFGQILGKRFDDFFLTRCCIKTNFSVNLGRNMSL
jgi:hypothetical protein